MSCLDLKCQYMFAGVILAAFAIFVTEVPSKPDSKNSRVAATRMRSRAEGSTDPSRGLFSAPEAVMAGF
jgi:hypothetical protein